MKGIGKSIVDAEKGEELKEDREQTFAESVSSPDACGELWEQVCSLLRNQLSEDIFERWIAVIHPGGFKEPELLELRVSNDFYSTWLEENYVPMIGDAFAAVTGNRISFSLVVDPTLRTQENGKSGGDTTPRPAAVREPSTPSRTPTPGHGRNGKNGSEATALNPRYVFETFVVGSSNDFAHAAAMAVAQQPARAYNPLFLYGGVGLGKTHLMQAVGNFATSRDPSCRVCYLSSETFVNEYIEALQNSKLTQFRKRFRNVDILLIDDVQFLAGKERLQEEFFHTFNALFDGHKQIVLTCDRPATEIPGLERRLVSRFEWGLVTEIDAPEFETRMAILRKKAELMNIEISDSVIRFIAERIAANVRRLEGALIRAASFASLTNRELTTEALERLLRDSLDDEAPAPITMERIQRTVAEHFDVRYSDILSRKRPANIALPRQVAMYLCRDLTSHSLPTIGDAFGKNHATVLHACRCISQKEKTDETLQQRLQTIRESLGCTR